MLPASGTPAPPPLSALMEVVKLAMEILLMAHAALAPTTVTPAQFLMQLMPTTLSSVMTAPPAMAPTLMSVPVSADDCSLRLMICIRFLCLVHQERTQAA